MVELRIGFVGLGNLGGPVATRIVQAGWPLAVWARRPEVLTTLVSLGAAPAGDLVELGRSADVVGILVTDADDIAEVLDGGLLEGMTRGGVIVIHSTVRPEACERFGELAARQGIRTLDAPLCGGSRAAVIGQIVIPVGGDADQYDRCLPMLEAFGGFIRHVGPLGSGQCFKLMYNLLYTANVEIIMDALDVGERAGLNRGALGEMFSMLPYTGYVGSMLATGTAGAAAVAHGRSMLVKDVDYALRMLKGVGVDPGSIGRLGVAGLESLKRYLPCETIDD